MTTVAIQQLIQRWLDATRAEDPVALADMVTEDAVFLPPGGPPLVGRAAVEAAYRALFVQFRVEQSPSFNELTVNGDWAYAWGTDALTMTPRSGGDTRVLRGHAVSILRKDTDGQWRFHRGINNMSLVTSTPNS